MEYEMNFKCTLDKFEEIPEEVIKETKVIFPDVHSNSSQMAVLAKSLKKYHKDSIIMLPFCLTVEAEALGADIKMGNEQVGPRVGEYVVKNVEDLKDIKLIDLTKERISEVLKTVENLNAEGETVSLVVQGPFTIMSSLMDPRLFYKALRKDKDAAQSFMGTVCESIVKYIEEGIKRGAKIISFGDSSGDIDIVGPKIYKDYSGRYSYSILKKVENKLGNSILHLCGKTSVSMGKAGFIKSIPIEVEKGLTYGEALNRIMKEVKSARIIGHNCIKKSSLEMRKSVVWKIELN